MTVSFQDSALQRTKFCSALAVAAQRQASQLSHELPPTPDPRASAVRWYDSEIGSTGSMEPFSTIFQLVIFTS